MIGIKIPITTSVNNELRDQAYSNNIEMNKALELGLKILLADVNLMDYPYCALTEKLNKFMDLSNKLQERINELEGTVETKYEDGYNEGAKNE